MLNNNKAIKIAILKIINKENIFNFIIVWQTENQENFVIASLSLH